ncbi:MAG TPA: VWA domain-containing protein [Chloroflexota bacterium]
MRAYRYSRWDGSQDIEPFTADDLMREIADEMLEDGDLQSALRRLLQRGAEFPSGRRMMGLQELLEKMRNARGNAMQRYNLGSIFDDIKEKLENIVKTEREGIERRLNPQGTADQAPEGSGDSGQGNEAGEQDASADQGGNPAGNRSGGQPQSPAGGSRGSSGQSSGAAPGSSDPMFRDIMESMVRKRLEQLDHLPPDVGGRIQELRDYDFMEPEAREQFEELMKMLQQQVLQSYFQNLQQSIGQLTPEGLQQIQEMVHDLNEMMKQRLKGEEPDFEAFKKKWGQMFPDDIQNLDQLLDHLKDRMAQMESLLNSMTPEMRQQLEEMLDSVFQDSQFQWEMAQLGANMQRLRPGSGGDEYDFSGDEPVSLQEAMKLMGDMNSMDDLERELLQAIRTNNASDLNSDEIGRILGEEARQMTQQMQEVTRMLEEAGLIQRRGKDWELTPRAIKKIGERALQDIFGKIHENAVGDHNLDHRGFGVERLDETKPYQYGDQFFLDPQKSVMNALIREGPGTPVSMKLDDFEIYRTEQMTQCSTVIMLDMSYSMMMGGRFQAGRKVALALDSLIRTKFPKDNLYVVAFSYFVMVLRPEMLLDSYWVEYGGGTNLQEGLRQARLVLSKHQGTKQIIMITDGQPTTFTSFAGMDPADGWGYGRRSPRAMEETLREVVRCTHDGITINTFMMERERYASDFVKTMAKVNGGRAFYASPNRLGEYILLDYVKNKRKVIH